MIIALCFVQHFPSPIMSLPVVDRVMKLSYVRTYWRLALLNSLSGNLITIIRTYVLATRSLELTIRESHNYHTYVRIGDSLS